MAGPPVVGRPLREVIVSEGKRNWPFVAGFGITFLIILKLSASLDPKKAKKSKFANPNAHNEKAQG